MQSQEIENIKYFYFGWSRFPTDKFGVRSQRILRNWLEEAGITDYQFEYSSFRKSVVIGISFKRESDYQLFYLTWC